MEDLVQHVFWSIFFFCDALLITRGPWVLYELNDNWGGGIMYKGAVVYIDDVLLLR